MGRAPCCDKANVKKGPWSPEEDAKLKEFIEKFGTGGNWIALPQKAGLKRCGKSCRLRWLNYLRPNIKHGEFSDDEDRIICSLYASIGSRWSIIAAQLPGRTDNDIKNYWNTKLKKKLMGMINNNNPLDQRKLAPIFASSNSSQSQSLLSFSSLSPFYTNSATTTKSLTGFEALALHQNLLYNNSNVNNIVPPGCGTNYHSDYDQHLQDSLMMNPNTMQFYPGKDNMLVFGGGTEASGSSSDGSCGQISYGKEIKQDHININGIQRQGYMLDYQLNVNGGVAGAIDHHHEQLGTWNDNDNNNNVDDDDQKHNVFSNNNNNNSTAQLQYDLEEVKQLISSSNNGCNNTSFFMDDDEIKNNNNNKTHERGGGNGMMYYYYY